MCPGSVGFRRTDFDFELPPDLIAQVPADRRDGSRLLDLSGPAPIDRSFPDIVELVPRDAVVVINDTRVVPARLRARKASGGAVELLVLHPAADGGWVCLARASKPLRAGAVLDVGAGAARATITGERAGDGTVTVAFDCELPALLSRAGELPLPPYIERPAGATGADRERYQTVYARVDGAVAAPTAGLHFTPAVLDALRARGCAIAPLTLHVGPGTFAPVRTDALDDHPMHAERFEIPDATAALVASGRPVVAVGTTVVRALESGATRGETSLFIRPGFPFRVVDLLLTNFHLPESTLLVLVSAFAGRERVLAAYREAVARRYRFFSYGDAMLIA